MRSYERLFLEVRQLEASDIISTSTPRPEDDLTSGVDIPWTSAKNEDNG